MSIKIWEAYKVIETPEKSFWDIVHELRVKATKNLKKKLRNDFRLFMKAVDPQKKPYKQRIKEGDSDEKARLCIVEEIMTDGWKRAATSTMNDIFDYETSIGFYHWNGQNYAIPYQGSGARGVWNFLKRHPNLVDFHYQNQTDPPKNISKKEFEKRSEIWCAIDAADRWKDALHLTICDYQTIWQLNPYLEILQKIHKRRKK